MCDQTHPHNIPPEGRGWVLDHSTCKYSRYCMHMGRKRDIPKSRGKFPKMEYRDQKSNFDPNEHNHVLNHTIEWMTAIQEYYCMHSVWCVQYHTPSSVAMHRWVCVWQCSPCLSHPITLWVEEASSSVSIALRNDHPVVGNLPIRQLRAIEDNKAFNLHQLCFWGLHTTTSQLDGSSLEGDNRIIRQFNPPEHAY